MVKKVSRGDRRKEKGVKERKKCVCVPYQGPYMPACKRELKGKAGKEHAGS